MQHTGNLIAVQFTEHIILIKKKDLSLDVQFDQYCISICFISTVKHPHEKNLCPYTDALILQLPNDCHIYNSFSSILKRNIAYNKQYISTTIQPYPTIVRCERCKYIIPKRRKKSNLYNKTFFPKYFYQLWPSKREGKFQ